MTYLCAAFVRVLRAYGFVHVALLIQHATRMYHIVTSFEAPMTLPKNGTIFEKLLLNIKCIFWLSRQVLSKTFIILRIIQWNFVINVKSLHVKYPLFLSDFNKTLIFSTDFRKKTQISSFIKILRVGSELFHEDGQTDMTKLLVAFRNFVNMPENLSQLFTYVFFPIIASHVTLAFGAL